MSDEQAGERYIHPKDATSELTSHFRLLRWGYAVEMAMCLDGQLWEGSPRDNPASAAMDVAVALLSLGKPATAEEILAWLDKEYGCPENAREADEDRGRVEDGLEFMRRMMVAEKGWPGGTWRLDEGFAYALIIAYSGITWSVGRKPNMRVDAKFIRTLRRKTAQQNRAAD